MDKTGWTGWIEWSGGKCPVPPETPIEPRYRGGEDPTKGVRMTVAPAQRLAWWHDGEDDDIIAYRIVEHSPSLTRGEG